MELIFNFNGAYEDIARAEAISLLEASCAQPVILREEQQMLLVRCGAVPAHILSRLALSHYSLKFLSSVRPTTGELDGEALGMVPAGSFRIRIKKIDKSLNSMEEERRLSDQILSATQTTVDLACPDTEIIGVHVGGLVHLGIVIARADAKEYNSRKPQHRPYFHPSSIDPRIARALVNISGATNEVMDPFCGTGGILIEAGLVGLDVYGIDIEEKMVVGAKENLAYYHIDGTVRLGDATDISSTYPRTFQAIITDVPYGKSTVVGGPAEDLYRKAFIQICAHCSGKAVIVLPGTYDFSSCGFSVFSHYSYRVHKSLNRHIYVLGHNTG